MINDVLVGTLRLAHALAAAAWLGGALAYALDRAVGGERSAIWLRELVRPAIGVFIITGTIMAMERLSSAPLPPLYLVILGIKICLALLMFALVPRRGAAPSSRSWMTPERSILILGVGVYALAIALRFVYEATIRQAAPIAAGLHASSPWI